MSPIIGVYGERRGAQSGVAGVRKCVGGFVNSVNAVGVHKGVVRIRCVVAFKGGDNSVGQ